MSAVWDETPCTLGEGPLWHPERRQLFWFDIIERRLLTREDGKPRSWQFDEHVSAAGWVDGTRLLIASETRLMVFDVESGAREDVHPLEADNPVTRSNDGRADPWGGFWIGTMGKGAEPEAGAIWRLYRGELRRLIAPITISNAICFAPDRGCAYFTDTPTAVIRRIALDPEHGWPSAEPEAWLDLSAEGWRPDGAVTDAAGNLWSAQWGGSRVACYSPEGRFLRAVGFGAAHTSCPAFGGDDLTTLFCTTACEGLSPEALGAAPDSGKTFAAEGVARGLPEPRVLL